MSTNIGDGDVSIFIDGEEYFLKPTLKACISLSNSKGGLTELVRRCADLEFSAIEQVIVAGLGKASKDLQELIFKSGLMTLSSPCITYLHIIANGGKPLTNNSDEEESEKKAKESL